MSCAVMFGMSGMPKDCQGGAAMTRTEEREPPSLSCGITSYCRRTLSCCIVGAHCTSAHSAERGLPGMDETAVSISQEMEAEDASEERTQKGRARSTRRKQQSAETPDVIPGDKPGTVIINGKTYVLATPARTKRLGLMISPEAHTELKRMAKKGKTSINNLCNIAIEEYIARNS